MLAAQSLGGAGVPLWPDAEPDWIAQVLHHAGVSVVVAEDAEQVEKLVAIKDRLPDLTLVAAASFSVLLLEHAHRRRRASWLRARSCSAAVWVIASLSLADPTVAPLPGSTSNPASATCYTSSVAKFAGARPLHAFACVAGSSPHSLPSRLRGAAACRAGCAKARPIALGSVVLVACFSLATQAYAPRPHPGAQLTPGA